MGNGSSLRVVALAALTCAAGWAGDARACINAIIEVTDANVASLKKADTLLEDGDPARAAATALGTVGSANAFATEGPRLQGPDAHLINRAYRIVAVAAVRLDGDLTIALPARTAAERQERVRWGVGRLDTLSKLRVQDPGSMTDLGEALELSFPGKASLIIEDLAKKDLVSTAYGYAALARLRAKAGNISGRDAALARCVAMTKAPAICDGSKRKS